MADPSERPEHCCHEKVVLVRIDLVASAGNNLEVSFDAQTIFLCTLNISTMPEPVK